MLIAWFNPVAIAFNSAILVAIIGLVVNGACALILKDDDHDHHSHAHAHRHNHASDGHSDHNLRSAYLHVLADALTSLLAIFALLAAKYFGLYWMDPIMGMVGAVLVTRWSWGLLRDTSGVLLDRQASDAVCQSIRDRIESDRDARISDLHVWSIGPSLYAAAIAVVADSPKSAQHYKRLIATTPSLAHVTIEVNGCT